MPSQFSNISTATEGWKSLFITLLALFVIALFSKKLAVGIGVVIIVMLLAKGIHTLPTGVLAPSVSGH